MEAYPIAQQIVRHINIMADLAKKISVLKTEIDPDGRIRTSYNIAGTSVLAVSQARSPSLVPEEIFKMLKNLCEDLHRRPRLQVRQMRCQVRRVLHRRSHRMESLQDALTSKLANLETLTQQLQEFAGRNSMDRRTYGPTKLAEPLLPPLHLPLHV
jgi:hypothetical protein